MEMTAAIEGLKALKRPCKVTLYTDSVYVRDGITKWIFGWQRNGWRTADRKPVKNAELWQALLEAARPHSVHWQWGKGHSGHPENERADPLACAAAERQRGCCGPVRRPHPSGLPPNTKPPKHARRDRNKASRRNNIP